MQEIPAAIKIKIHAAGSHSIVGSDSKDSTGQSVSKENGFKLSDPYNRRLKRLQDIIVSVISLLTFPIHLLFVKKPFTFFKNCFTVLFAQKTWVGYCVEENRLPKLRQSILGSNGLPIAGKQLLPIESLQMMDYWYARDYELLQDLKLITKMYRRLGG